jgi:hypothetical protein
MAKSFQLPEEYYPFIQTDETEATYRFITKNDVEYKLVFKATPNVLVDKPPYAHLLYELSLLAKFAGTGSYVRDDLIAATIAAIFIDFINQHDENICFYICDFSDERQHVRARKFEEWFQQFHRGGFLKLDISFKGYDGSAIPASLIMAKGNRYVREITAAVFHLLFEYNNEK